MLLKKKQQQQEKLSTIMQYYTSQLVHFLSNQIRCPFITYILFVAEEGVFFLLFSS